MKEEVDKLQTTLDRAVEFLLKFTEKGFVKSMLTANLDAGKFAEFDSSVRDHLNSMGQVV